MPDQEQAADQSPTVENFTEMPSVEDFGNLEGPLQEQLVQKFGPSAAVDQETQNSKTPEKTSPEEKSSKEGVTKPNKSESKKVETPKEEKTTAHQELESEFTRRSQKLKQLEGENTQLQERLARLEGLVEGKSEKSNESEESPLAQLKKKSPDAAPILDALEKVIKDEVSKRVVEQVKPIEEQVSRRDEDENLSEFSKQVDEFLNSDLGKEFEKELNDIIDGEFENKDKLLEAAKRDPQLFLKLKKELIFKHQDKIFEFKFKSSEEDPQKRNQEINDLGVSGKAKTGKSKAPDPMDIKEFKQLKTSDEMEKLLDTHGAVEKT